MRLHRFDSDDQDGDATLQPKKEKDEAAAGSEDEDANGLGDSSCSSSEDDEDDVDDQDRGGTKVKGEIKQEDNTDCVSSPPGLVTSRPVKPARLTREEAAASSTRHIAHVISSHASSSISSDQNFSAPPPLTYKETVRLVRLIAMIFRFPKPLRRVSRQRKRQRTSTESDTAAPSSSASTDLSTTSTIDDTKLQIELKPKYSTSSSRRPRLLAKVHPEDAQKDSAAVLKLLALIPAALPARVPHAEWVVGLAMRARRDEHGNIFLPDDAYGAPDEEVRVKKEEEEEGLEGQVTRAKRQRLGQEAPAIPWPDFWRRNRGGEAGCKTKSEGDATEFSSAKEEEAEVDGLLLAVSASSDEVPGERSRIEIEQAAEERSEAGGRSRVVNLSKLLAERMRDKRQAKTLLLRTHQSLRKRKSQADESGLESGEAAAEEVGQEEMDEVDPETAANTLANSGAGPGIDSENAAAAETEAAKTQAAESDAQIGTTANSEIEE